MQEQGAVLFLTLVMILTISMITISLLSIVGKQRITAINYQQNLENEYLLKAAVEKAEQKLREDLDDNKPWRTCDLVEMQFSGNVKIKELEDEIIIVNYELKKVVDEQAKVNPNLLSSSQLRELPGVGTVLSTRIEQRVLKEEIIAIEELKTIKDLGTEKYKKMRPFITINTQGKINLNTASDHVLETLPGIGLITAVKIINYRQINGPFNTKDKIQNVAGIGAVTYHQIAGQITVESDLFTAVFEISIPTRNVEQEVIKLIKLNDD